jgi:ABC-type transport system involved in multi-copper enzyme maturation permease subunit
MGIDPIRYKPWEGKRTSLQERIFIMSRTLFMKKMKSKGVIVLMVLGYLGVWAFPIIFYSLMPHEALDGATMSSQMGSGTLFIFTALLTSLVCSDAISEDLRSNSFVLYFSRAMKKENYLAGKVGGIFMVLALFCLLPAIIMAVAILGTQSGNDYLSGIGVLGLTVLSGFVCTIFLIPLALMMSSLTNRKSFAAVGTFMVFIILTIIGNIFSEFDRNWRLLDPSSLIAYFNDWIYGQGIPFDVSGWLAAAVFSAFLIIPLAIIYLRLHLKEVGK